MPVENLTENLQKAQSIDFVERFGRSVTQLVKMLGISRKMPVAIGTTIKTYKSTVTLDGTKVAKGEVIPLSEVKQEPGKPIELEWDKHRKAVAVEDVQKYGFDIAIEMTDEKLIRELQKNIRDDFFVQLATGTGSATGEGLQGALAQAWGQVQVAFEDEGVRTIAFINPLDAADYLAKANITIQNAFGLSYVENFLGVDLVVLTAAIDKGVAYATAAENLNLAYALVNGGEIDKAFDFVTDETGIIGVTHDVNKQRLTAETVTLSGIALYAERLDGVIKINITEPAAEETGA